MDFPVFGASKAKAKQRKNPISQSLLKVKRLSMIVFGPVKRGHGGI